MKSKSGPTASRQTRTFSTSRSIRLEKNSPLPSGRACGAVAEDLCCGKAHLLQLLILSRQLVLVLGDVHHRGVDPHLVTGLAAQQLVDGTLRALPLMSHSAMSMAEIALIMDRTTEIDRTQEVLVEVLDAEGVFPDQVVREFFNGRCSCLQIAPVARFTPDLRYRHRCRPEQRDNALQSEALHL